MTRGLFPRQMRLILTDEGGEGIDLGKLSAKFKISRSAAGAIGRAKISVFNLSDTTIAKLQGRYTKIRLDAGYPQRIGTIFEGEVRNSFTTKDGPDKITDIFASDSAFDYSNSFVSAKFPAGSSLKSIVQTVAATFENTVVGSLEFLTDQTTVGPMTLSGMTRDEMRKLSESYGFRWSIQGVTFQAIDLGRSGGQSTLEVSRESGMIDSPLASTSGVEVLTLLDHRIVPGRRIDVITAGAQVTTSDTALQTSDEVVILGREFREFDVLRLIHVGESRGQAWYTKAYAIPAGRI